MDHQFNSGGGNFVALSTPQPVIARLEMQCLLQGIDNFTFNAPVAVLRGDMDCNGVLEMADVEPFVLALIDAPAYMSAFPLCDVRRADMNCDRKEDGLDVQGFADALTTP